MDVGRAGKTLELERLQREAAQRTAGAASSVERSDQTSVAISKPADMLKRLSALNQSDPERFKLLMGQMSANLRAAANTPSGAVGEQLQELSANLARAANTGDLSALSPSLNTPISGSSNRALDAYRRNMPARSGPSETVKQAMEYVLSVVSAEP